MLGKPVEVLSFQQGRAGLEAYLREAGALPLRDYVPLVINYTVLALFVLEDKGSDFETADVARAWLRLLPAGSTWTAERAAYCVLLNNMSDEFVNGEDAGFDLDICSDNDHNEWIGAQIRADLYGWVCPGRPALAAELARRDASFALPSRQSWRAGTRHCHIAARESTVPLSLPRSAPRFLQQAAWTTLWTRHSSKYLPTAKQRRPCDLVDGWPASPPVTRPYT
jgi:hypothetical protein